MPPDEKHWSVFNIRWRQERSLSTVWRQQRESIPVFKSWVDRDAPLPEPLYHLTSYQHPLVTVDYFQAQQRLAELQGRRNLWFAGVYTHDIDSHESAIQSAIYVARRLAPSSRNLSRLL
jgi:predicted NAD/FAD-binding protein